MSPGESILPEVEVQNVSIEGIFVFVLGSEYFLSFDEYPWFRDASVGQICRVELIAEGTGIRWPDLDAELEIESLKSPEKYPLKFRAG
ncbi:MAG: DUF2442 domain-containing protein [Pseudomonadota bacterium]